MIKPHADARCKHLIREIRPRRKEIDLSGDAFRAEEDTRSIGKSKPFGEPGLDGIPRIPGGAGVPESGAPRRLGDRDRTRRLHVVA
jgi:hypothetical protein